jgi:penicillin G amidase
MRLAAVAGAVALAVAGVVPGALGAAAAAGTAPATQGFTIARSSYGVPTITATSQARMWFGVGWAQAQDRMVQLELTRRAVEGTLSAGTPSPHLCDQVGLFNDFRYKNMPPT